MFCSAALPSQYGASLSSQLVITSQLYSSFISFTWFYELSVTQFSAPFLCTGYTCFIIIKWQRASDTKMDFKPSNGFFDLCINVSSENDERLKDLLLRLYQSKLFVCSIYSTHCNSCKIDEIKKEIN